MIKKLLLTLVFIPVTSLFFVITAHAGVNLSVTPASGNVNKGQNFYVYLNFSQTTTTTAGYSVNLTYSGPITYVGTTQLQSTTCSVYHSQHTLSTKTIYMDCATLSGALPANAYTRLEFRADNTGTAAFALSGALAGDGITIDSQTGSNLTIVTSGGTLPATALGGSTSPLISLGIVMIGGACILFGFDIYKKRSLLQNAQN